MIQVSIQGEQWVVIQLVKITLVLTKAQFVEGLKRGKVWRRRQSFEARVEKAP